MPPMPTPEPLHAASPAGREDGLPRRIGRYRIVRLLGRGGMGSVYEAEQDEPRRTVALKVLHRVDDDEALARFRYESAILARLSHPCIAHVHDAGTWLPDRDGDGAARGVPWFAMEFVEGGLPVVEAAERRALSLTERVELLLAFCDAVQYGHEKGVIHRDLKPANLLVDGQGRPKIIDFGVARLTEADGAARTLETGAGQVLGTLRYMSPEQVSGKPGAVDVRSDVFALGLVLHELVSGAPAYDLASRSLTDAARIVSEGAPPLLRSVSPGVPPELEWIVAKACARERGMRYASASELAADLRRFLAGAPVVAAPPSRTYQLRAFARRHRVAVVAAAVVLAALVGSLAVLWRALEIERSSLELERLSKERVQQALQAEQEARRLVQSSLASEQDARTRTEELLEAEQVQRVRAQGHAEFLRELMRSVAPAEEGYEVRVVDVLDEAVRRLPERFGDQPLLRADLQEAIAEAYLVQSRHTEALELARAADAARAELLPEGDASRLASRRLVAAVRGHLGDLDVAERELRAVLAEQRARLGPGHGDTLESLAALVDTLVAAGELHEAKQLLGDALREVPVQTDPPDAAALVLIDRGAGIMALLGAVDEGHPVDRLVLETLDRIDQSSAEGVAETMQNRAFVLAQQGRVAEAQELMGRVADAVRRRSGPRSDQTLAVLANQSTLCIIAGEPQQGLELVLQAHALAEELYGPDHPTTIDIAFRVANARWAVGQRDEAVATMEAVVEAGRAALPAGHWQRGDHLGSLGRMEFALGRTGAAEAHLDEALAILAASVGDASEPTQHVLRFLLELYEGQGRADEAEAVRARLATEVAPAPAAQP